MTVKELIDALSTIAPERQGLEVRVWLPGSHITIDGEPFVKMPSALNQSPVILVEGNVVEGSALSS